jgi:threonine dehydrogenase-like Zn-dependent dehydrogenase
VAIRIRFSGVCHSDIHTIRGTGVRCNTRKSSATRSPVDLSGKSEEVRGSRFEGRVKRFE